MAAKEVQSNDSLWVRLVPEMINDFGTIFVRQARSCNAVVTYDSTVLLDPAMLYTHMQP